MIKLVDLLDEMAMTNISAGSYDRETGNVDWDKRIADIEKIIPYIRSMGINNPVIWRGIEGTSGFRDELSITYITGDRTAFMGGHNASRELIQYIFKKSDIQPIFGTLSFSKAKFFGKPMIVVLEPPYTIYQSSEIDDVMVYGREYGSETDATGTVKNFNKDELTSKMIDGAETYSRIKLSQSEPGRELVIDAKNYWAISVKDKSLNSIRTYGDVIKEVNKHLWMLNKRAKGEWNTW